MSEDEAHGNRETPCEPPSEVRNALNNLGNCLDDLENLVDRLSTRLEDVLVRVINDDNEADEAVIDDRCTLTRRIHEHVDHALKLRKQVEDMLAELRL